MNSVMGPVNSAWTMHFVSCTVNPCDVTIHMRWKKKKKPQTWGSKRDPNTQLVRKNFREKRWLLG